VDRKKLRSQADPEQRNIAAEDIAMHISRKYMGILIINY